MDLILRGLKTIEVRTWEVKRRGPILLHASGSVDWKAACLFGYTEPLAPARGALVGYAEIVDVFQFTPERWLATAVRHWVVAPSASPTGARC
jgi:ASCH domain